ncbi:MAG TPA: hypothetical protein EYN67_07845 [Flavobacteriales bacterium]|nr:hypothetical protein [Methylococcaceae bacterium]HHZ95457.1 hypothetical protein [Flavobacteriales bacterium]
MSNLKLWKSVEETDVKYTKKAKKGMHKFTSITPMSQFKKATEQFGIQGIGWGIKIGSEVFMEQTIGTTSLLNYDAILFFKYEGELGEIPVHATEKLSYQTQGANGYLKIDDEVRKKVVTNAKTKGLSELGFNADIFMGQFDDPNYVDYIAYEQSINQAEDKEEEIKAKIEEFNVWCRSEVACYTAIKNERTLNLLLGGHKQKLQGRCRLLGLDENAYTKQFESAYNNQLKTIKEGTKK